MKKGIVPIQPVLFLVVLLGVLGGQADPGNTIPADARNGRPTETEMLTGEDAANKQNVTGRTEVTLGREFSLTLASNATTGYQWQLAAPLEETIVKLVGSSYEAPKSGLIGAGGKEVWTFRAVGRGHTIIELKYVRPWEDRMAPARTASHEVIVH